MSKTITVNIDESLERRFKEKARLKYGNKKGSLAKAFNEAIDEWLKSDQNEILNENMKLLNEGIQMKQWNFKREELYE